MAINKVDLASGETLIDLTNDSATESVVFEGATFHGSDGETKTGTFTISEEITEQDSLIAQIKLALAGKAAGGGSEALPTQEKTVNITANGTYEALPDDGYTLSKVTANVNVPIPDGYIKPIGTLAITKNGEHDAKAYEKVAVNVPIPDGYIVPSGTKEINQNGTHDVTQYASVEVAVPDREIVLQDIEATKNGTYSADAGFDGIGQVTVNVAGSGGGGTDLPAGYTRVDYIQFSGNQMIDTGIIGNQDTQIFASFTWENSTQRYLLGCSHSDNTAAITAYMNGSWRFGNKVASKSISVKDPMLPYSALLNKTTIAATSGITAISGVNDFETIGTVLLGGCRSSSGGIPSAGIVGKVFECIIWQADVRVLHLVPVVDENGNYYFCDLIGKNLYASVTSNPLSGGNW